MATDGRARLRPGAGWWLLAAVLVAGAAMCCWLVAGDSHYTTAHRQAAAWTWLLVIVALGVAAHVVVLAYQFRPGANNRPVRLEAGADSGQTLRFRRRGLKAALIGADGRASTSKAQVVLWTAAVIAGLADLLLLTRSFPGGTLFTDAVTKNWHSEYLVPLGRPVAAAILAKAAVSASYNGQGPVTRATALRLADAKHTAAIRTLRKTSGRSPPRWSAHRRRWRWSSPRPGCTHGSR